MTSPSGGEYVYSSNGENFDGEGSPNRSSAREEALYELELATGQKYFTGRAVPIRLSEFVEPVRLLEDVYERLYDAVWMVEYPPSITPQAREELKAAVDQWAEKFVLNPTSYRVVDVEEHTA